MKGGASDFLTKAVDEELLLAAVERALHEHRIARRDAIYHAGLLASRRSLTLREQEVLSLLVTGRLNKQNCGGSGNRRVHGSDTPRQHYAEDESGLMCHLGQTGGNA